ncbi:MAG: VWA domain-containing protein [Isosphaeraceae bacterium]
MNFAAPAWLILVVLAPLPWLLDRLRPRIAWPSIQGFGFVGSRAATVKGNLPFVLRGMAIVCVAVALARPRTVGGHTRIAGGGVAIIVALDQSSSMTIADFSEKPGSPPITRLDAARNTLARFIEGRPDDLIGLVVFANYPDLASPLTLDHEFLLATVRSVRPARPGDDGTNLGDALVWSLQAIKDARPRKKVVILLTDGRNSPAVPRPTDPSRAAEIAQGLGVVLHTIAVGKGGTVIRMVEPTTGLPVTTESEGPDLELLERLAVLGGGRAFVATNAGELDRIFKTLDSLEKSPLRGVYRTRYREDYGPWALGALGLLLTDLILSARWVLRLP